MYVPLNTALKPDPAKKTGWEREDLITAMTDKQRLPWQDRGARVKAGTLAADADVFTQSAFPVAHNLGQGGVYHRSYLEYLNCCYANHYEAVLRPDDVWYTLLTQLGLVIKKDPDKYATLFTTTPDTKREISVMTPYPWELPVDKVIDMLRLYAPTNVDAFLPTFTTTTLDVRMASFAAFADLVSPYYDYSTYCCGIPAIHVAGTSEDWFKLYNSWARVMDLLQPEGAMRKYFKTVLELLSQISKASHDVKFWKDIFGWERCGSGSENEITGWWRKFFLEQPKFPAKLQNFATCIATVNYTHLPTKQKFTMYQGCLSSKLNLDVLLPSYNWIVCEHQTAQEIVEVRPPSARASSPTKR
jgi:hypothetical protein